MFVQAATLQVCTTELAKAAGLCRQFEPADAPAADALRTSAKLRVYLLALAEIARVACRIQVRQQRIKQRRAFLLQNGAFLP